jgi:hypothetical protein
MSFAVLARIAPRIASVVGHRSGLLGACSQIPGGSSSPFVGSAAAVAGSEHPIAYTVSVVAL